MPKDLSEQLRSFVTPHLESGETVARLAFAYDDTDVPLWKKALLILLILLLLPIHIFLGALPGGGNGDGYAVALTNRRLLLVPVCFDDALFWTRIKARKGALVAWSVDRAHTLRVAIDAHDKEPELRLSIQDDGTKSVTKVLFLLRERHLPSNGQQAQELAERLRHTCAAAS